MTLYDQAGFSLSFVKRQTNNYNRHETSFSSMLLSFFHQKTSIQEHLQHSPNMFTKYIIKYAFLKDYYILLNGNSNNIPCYIQLVSRREMRERVGKRRKLNILLFKII